MLLAATEKSLAIPDSLLLSLTGIMVVFVALMALIAVIRLITALAGRKEAISADTRQPEAPAPAPASAAAVAGMVPAAGSLGEIDLYEVDDRSAALIMAIVADSMKAPLNTLRFKSIRQISEVE